MLEAYVLTVFQAHEGKFAMASVLIAMVITGWPFWKLMARIIFIGCIRDPVRNRFHGWSTYRRWRGGRWYYVATGIPFNQYGWRRQLPQIGEVLLMLERDGKKIDFRKKR